MWKNGSRKLQTYLGLRAVWRLQKHCSCLSYFKLHYRIHCHWEQLLSWLMLYCPLMVRGNSSNDKRRLKPVWVISRSASMSPSPVSLGGAGQEGNWVTLTNDSRGKAQTEVARIWPLRMFECHSFGVCARARGCSSWLIRSQVYPFPRFLWVLQSQAGSKPGVPQGSLLSPSKIWP